MRNQDVMPTLRLTVELHQFGHASRLDPPPDAKCSAGSHRNQSQTRNDLASALDRSFIHLHFELLMLQGIFEADY